MQLHQRAHTLKGSSAQVGAVRLASHLQRLEDAAIEVTPDERALAELVSSILKVFDETLKVL
jgi:HPt (histidine-containing phosphotransfer) domain-containing protein